MILPSLNDASCLIKRLTASVAKWLRAWDTLTMFEATVCGRSFNPRPGQYSRMSFSSDQVTGKGPFKCYVTQMGVGGVRFSGEKRYEGAMLLALRGGGWGSNFQENSVT